ncbi:ABC-three component system middle component 6 [Vagococcus fluvialis]|uniref:ABC-three component system middle component 6 n=1 Tax=Vagococcus fluvialis TaxID=2738 RepID=UPI003873BE3F
MILPNKYVSFPESLIGLSAYILDIIGEKEMRFEEIYNSFLKNKSISKKLKYYPTMEKFTMCITFMYMSGMISYKEGGIIFNENLKP